MKKIIILLLSITTFLNCSNDDDNTSVTDNIVGEWKLIEARVNEFGPIPTTTVTDYSNENIIYNFQANGVLSITGANNNNIGYSNGNHDYFFGEDYLSGDPTPEEEKILLVKIGNTKWIYSSTNGQIKINNSYVDGPDLIFERN